MSTGNVVTEIRVGLLGFGTIGAGMVKCIAKNADIMAGRTGVRLRVSGIADLDISTDRGVPVDSSLLTTDALSVIDSPDVDVIVELVGGTGIAKDFVLRALRNGKPVVTANKALLAYHGEEIFSTARDHGVDVYYEASVAGGIPIIKSLREGLSANRFDAIYGILNGTCNYILTRMENEGILFDDVLKEAQEMGYAEAEPSLDIDGDDTAHKTCVLASLAFGKWFGMDDIGKEGIRGIALEDIHNAAEAGYRIKVLGIIKNSDGKIEMRVHPTLVPAKSMLGSVDDVFNAVCVNGDFVGPTMFYGRGAGQDATASAVVADLIDVGLNLCHDASNRVPGFQPHNSELTLAAAEDMRCRYYLRLMAVDHPDVLAQITHALGVKGINIASIHQKESDEETVPVIVITDIAREGDITKALVEVAALGVTQGPPVRLRIEDL
jgi:homoserine dehydrogenase